MTGREADECTVGWHLMRDAINPGFPNGRTLRTLRMHRVTLDAGNTEMVSQLCVSMSELRKQFNIQAANLDALRRRVAELERAPKPHRKR
jgi:hypothetical protein